MKFLEKLRKKRKCFFCGTDLKRETTFFIEYKTFEGIFKAKTCEQCAKDLDEMKSLYNGEIDG